VSERARRGLLDTNVIIHLPQIDPLHLPFETAISSITLAELSAGPLATDDPAERGARIGPSTRPYWQPDERHADCWPICSSRA